MASATAIRISWTLNPESFDRLKPDWDNLLNSAGNQTSPFHSHTWILCCWKAPGNQIRIGWMHDARGMAVAAFVFTCDLDKGMAPLVPIRMLGMVPHISNAHPGNLIYLLRKGTPQDLPMVPMLRELAKTWRWHAAFINFLTEEKAFLRAAFNDLSREFGWHMVEGQSSTDAWIAIDSGRDAYLAQRSAKFRQNQRRARKALMQMGQLLFREAGTCGDTWLVAEKHLLVGFSRCWQAESRASPMHPDNREAMLSACQALYEEGVLQLFFVELNGRPIAFEFGLSDAAVYYPAVRGMDPEFAKHSPGNILAEESIDFYHRRGLKGIYLGPIQMSAQTRYKTHWLTEEHLVPNMMIIPPGSWYACLHSTFQRYPLFRKIWWRFKIGKHIRRWL